MMKMNRRTCLGLMTAIGLCSGAYAAPAQKRTAVVFYSRTGNVEKIARLTAELLGADLIEIEPQTPYPTAYSETTALVEDQMNRGIVPPNKPLNRDFSQYDVIYLGSPTWWGHIARPVERFLTDQRFSGKTIRLFTSHGGSGRAQTQVDVLRLCPQCRVPASAPFYGTAGADEAALRRWIEEDRERIVR